MAIVFSKSGLSDLTLERGRLLPLTEPIELNQDLYLTESNSAVVIDYGNNLEFIELNFKYLSEDNYDGTVNGLKTWFQTSTINYCENTFTITDEQGASYTVRLWQEKFNMIMHANGRYSISLRLKKE